jgi:hypothetical protein
VRVCVCLSVCLPIMQKAKPTKKRVLEGRRQEKFFHVLRHCDGSFFLSCSSHFWKGQFVCRFSSDSRRSVTSFFLCLFPSLRILTSTVCLVWVILTALTRAFSLKGISSIFSMASILLLFNVLSVTTPIINRNTPADCSTGNTCPASNRRKAKRKPLNCARGKIT